MFPKALTVALFSLYLSSFAAQALPKGNQNQESCGTVSVSTVFQTATVTVTAGGAASTGSSTGNTGSSSSGSGSSSSSGSNKGNSGSNNNKGSTGSNNNNGSTGSTGSKGSTGSSGSSSGSSSGKGSDNSSSGSNSSPGNTGTSTTTASTSSSTGSSSTGNNAATKGGSGNNAGNNAGGADQSSLTLDASVIAKGFESDGQAVAEAGQVPSLTSSNNFINFCATVPNLPIMNGQQIKTGSCNPAPMGIIAATTNMPSSKFQFPPNFGTIQANQPFTVKMAIQNLETGNFVNANTNYFSAPQQVNKQGDVIGHTHFVIEKIDSLTQTTVTNPGTFAFFKGVNTAAVGGVVTADVTAGLPAGVYRLASINSAANHQPVLVAIAQHGSLDDMIYFTVSDNAAAASNATAGAGAANNATATDAAGAANATTTAIGKGAANATESVSLSATATASGSASVSLTATDSAASASATDAGSKGTGAKGGKAGSKNGKGADNAASDSASASASESVAASSVAATATSAADDKAAGKGGKASATAAATSSVAEASSAISIKDSTGQELNIEALRRGGGAPAPASERVSPAPPASPALKRDPRRASVRIESPEQKAKRQAEEQAKAQLEKEKENKERKEKEEKERRERDKKEAELKEKKLKEEKEKRESEEKERKKREEEERVKKEKEAVEKRKLEEEERVRKEKEAAEKQKLDEERSKKEAAEKEQAERDKADKAKEAEAKAEAPAAEKEEGEIEDKAAAKESAPADDSKKSAEKESLRIDTAVAPEHPRRRPGPLNLSTAAPGSIPAPLPSALATARIIEDLGSVPYPEGINSPKVELNVNAPAGKFKYDRDFLLQFMQICKEKPDNLPPLDAIGLEPSEQTSYNITRGGSGRRTTSSMSGGPSAVAARQASIGLGFIPGSMSKSGSSGFAMGNFSTAAGVGKMSSEERFAMANGGRSTSVGGLAGVQGGPGPGKERDRTRSKRGEKRSDSNRVSVGHQPQMSNMGSMGPPLEPVAPLEMTANRWVPTGNKRVAPADQESPEIVDRKVKGLLNKLTMERFDSISDQIVAWANKSEKEKDGRTLIQVIRLVFEKATDEATFSEMYARLCRKMMEMISSKVQDDGIKNAEGKPITGGLLFRKYLLNRCQEDFERGWVQKEATAAAAATKATEDQAAKAAANGKDDKDGKDGKEESELYSDEYYAAAKAKRRGLGLIRFIGELFKLQMLTERIMHECIKKLLGNVENPEEEEIESLCKLLTTVGQSLDTQKAHAHMDVYFSRMKELCKSGNVNSRMQFMLQDIIELRERKWIPRTQAAAPATIAQIHEAAAKEKAAQDKESYQRQMSMSRGGSRRGGDRGGGESHIGPDGWVVAGNAPSRAPAKAGDLSHFGKINKAQPMTFGPSGVFAGKKDLKATGRETPISRTASTSNMFLALSGNPEIPAEVNKPSRPPSRKPSVDLGQAGVPEAPQRRRLQLLPRSKPVDSKTGETPAGSEAGSDDERLEDAAAAETSMSEADAKKKIDEDAKEFFSIRSIDEAENYFSALPSAHHFRLVDKLAMQAVESKATDAELVANFFKRAREKDLCTPAAFEEGFMPLAEIIDDVAIDAPKGAGAVRGDGEGRGAA
ncbi:hypothetical protein EVG20_g9603 [Dentipellis fragilis]|uniref:MI domain-containing protein n=1 Tax=Dentipellis fragilis TaxID=205917 RepID=A0A4Y9XX25_9AGAM|nr:hypothetical protein EVG20_g9603 [Dentipellis fragilis]